MRRCSPSDPESGGGWWKGPRAVYRPVFARRAMNRRRARPVGKRERRAVRESDEVRRGDAEGSQRLVGVAVLTASRMCAWTLGLALSACRHRECVRGRKRRTNQPFLQAADALGIRAVRFGDVLVFVLRARVPGESWFLAARRQCLGL